MWALSLIVISLCWALTCSAPSSDKRIVSGKHAKNGDVPWLVGFHFNYVNNPPIFCGGALIDASTIITAAHCFKTSKRPRDYTVLVGESSVSKVSSKNKFKVSRIVIHPRYMYSYPDKTNDIALVKLSRPIKVNEYSKPISLPSGSGDRSAQGTKCMVAGWGRTENSGSSWSLLKTTIEIKDMKACKKEYAGIIWSKPDTQVCAGGSTNSNVCQGDSGGPMACQRNGKWVLEGAVSFGNKYCGRSPIKYPAVFTRISSFLGWIKYMSQ